MLICDQYLAVAAIKGVLPEALQGQRLAIATSQYWLLVRAEAQVRLHPLERPGKIARLIQGLPPELREQLVAPPPEVIQVLDFRDHAAASAVAAVDHRLNLLAADLVGAAIHYQGELRFAEYRTLPPDIEGTDGGEPLAPYEVLHWEVE